LAKYHPVTYLFAKWRTKMSQDQTAIGWFYALPIGGREMTCPGTKTNQSTILKKQNKSTTQENFISKVYLQNNGTR
jgi:hypothetical protein